MQIPVLIEPIANGFRAHTGEPLPLTAEGATREEALRWVKEKIQEQISQGAELVTLEAPADNPWPPMFGVFRDDPDFDAWQEAIAEYRRQVDEDPLAR